MTTTFLYSILNKDRVVHSDDYRKIGATQVTKRSFLMLMIMLCGFFVESVQAQQPDMVYHPNIRSVRFHVYGNQLALPVYNLNSNEQMELNFDDMDGNVKSYYYSFVLCDQAWVPVDLNAFLYTKGFTQNRIATYRYSSIALTKYTHYQAFLPDRNSVPTRSGNYMLKVFLDGDTAKLAFTQRFLVVDQKATVSAQVVQPMSPQLFRTSQKIRFSVLLNGVNSFSAAQQVKVVILQNNRWDNALKNIAPTFVRGNSLEYTTEDIATFLGGKEWRWLDLRSFRLQSDRVDSATYNKTSTEIFLKTDIDRSGQRYVYYNDLNGMYSMETYETINPYWQADYAMVHFSLAAPNDEPYAGKDIYLAGQLTDYQFNDANKMVFNTEKHVYENQQFLKQGYYNYTYIAVDQNNPANRYELEGDHWETENTYTILVYYKGFNDRTDQLLGVGKVNSRTDRSGISF